MTDYSFPVVELQRLMIRLHEACIVADQNPSKAWVAHELVQTMRIELEKLARAWPVAAEAGSEFDWMNPPGLR